MDLKSEPLIHIRIRSTWQIEHSVDGQSLVARCDDGTELSFSGGGVGQDEATELLASGASIRDLRSLLARTSTVDDTVSYLVMLQQWLDHRLLEFVLVDDGEERATLLTKWRGYVPSLAEHAPQSDARLDRFACLRDHGDWWQLDSPLCGLRVRMSDPAMLKDILVRRALAAAGYFDRIGKDGECDDGDDLPRQTALRQWEFHDLTFHVRHRRGWTDDPAGASRPFVGETSQPPCLRPPWPGVSVDLARSDTSTPLARLLESRRSVRRYDETKPISVEQLGILLDRCARIRATEDRELDIEGESAGKVARRPYPSAGSRWELEIYPIVNRCTGLESAVYHYDAREHRLVRIAERDDDVEAMIGDVGLATGGLADPQILLVIAARFDRVMWTYRSIAYGLILRNTGVLYQSLYLASTEMGLAPCALGSGNSRRFARLTGLDPLIEGSVGEFILGGRPIGQGH